MPANIYQSHSILFICDDKDIIDRIKKNLDTSKYKFIICRSFQKDRSLFEEENLILILLCTSLKKSSSVAVCKKLMIDKKFIGVPVSIIVKELDNDLILDHLTAGADDFISLQSDESEIRMRLQFQITKKSSIASEKVQSYIKLSRKMKAVGLLAEGIAHDLNNYLGGMIGYISLLKAKAKPKDDTVPVLSMLEKASDEAADVITRLLDFAGSKIEGITEININETAEKSLKLIKNSILKNIRKEVKLTKRLPNILGNTSQLEQLVIHLVFAATNKLSNESGELLIRTNFHPLEKMLSISHKLPVGNYISIEISLTKDQPEIPDDEKTDFLSVKKSFDSGLDLAIARNIVNDFNGFFYSDIKDVNTLSFYAYFPTIESNSKPSNNSNSKEITSEDKKSGLILVIDDESIILQLISDTLELLGYNGLLAETGSQGMELFKKHHFEIDLVILDLDLPDINGDLILQKLRKIKPQQKVLVASGYEFNQKEKFLKKVKVNDYLSKPFKIHDLEMKLNQLL